MKSERSPISGMPLEDDFYGTRRARPIGGRIVVALVLLVMIGGLGALVWTMTGWKDGPHIGWGSDETANSAVAATTDTTQQAANPVPGTAPAGPLEGRVLDLEQRVIRVQVAAQSASSYANRAEAIMVAFAARRSLDAGQPLGYLEGQMRLLFGDAQPKAVATIVNAAADPVTINKLRAGLDDINGLVGKGDPREGWWSSAMRSFGSMVTLRRAGAPAPDPDQRLARARRAVEAGQIEDAIKEMAALPAQPTISQWLEQARRYNEARRALDVIEQAAILEPRTAPIVAPAATAPAAGALPAPAPGAPTPGAAEPALPQP